MIEVDEIVGMVATYAAMKRIKRLDKERDRDPVIRVIRDSDNHQNTPKTVGSSDRIGSRERTSTAIEMSTP